MTESEWYMAESLVYERAESTLSAIMTDLAKQRNDNTVNAKRNGTTPDRSYQIVIDALADIKKRFAVESDALWIHAETLADVSETAAANACNAVIQKAAEDYEAALCGNGSDCERDIILIEKFMQEGSSAYTTINCVDVLERIRAAQPLFREKAKKHIVDIKADTVKNRHVSGGNRRSRYKCPLCGGGMYAYGHAKYGMQQVRCTGCYLYATIQMNKPNGNGKPTR